MLTLKFKSHKLTDSSYIYGTLLDFYVKALSAYFLNDILPDSFKMVCFVQRRNLYIEKHYNPAYHKAFVAYLRYGTAVTVPYYIIKAASPEHYIWRTQEDNKVRLTHAVNNGKIFA